MNKNAIVIVVAGLWFSGSAAAQQGSATPLPPDVNPVTLTRLPQLTRDDLDDEVLGNSARRA